MATPLIAPAERAAATAAAVPTVAPSRTGAAIIAEAAYRMVAAVDVRPDVLSLLKMG